MGRGRRQPGGSYITRMLRGPGGLWCYITQRVARGKVLSNTRVGAGPAGDPPDKELGHLEVGEWAVAQKTGKGKETWASSFIYWLIHSGNIYCIPTMCRALALVRLNSLSISLWQAVLSLFPDEKMGCFV